MLRMLVCIVIAYLSLFGADAKDYCSEDRNCSPFEPNAKVSSRTRCVHAVKGGNNDNVCLTIDLSNTPEALPGLKGANAGGSCTLQMAGSEGDVLCQQVASSRSNKITVQKADYTLLPPPKAYICTRNKIEYLVCLYARKK